MIDSYTDWKNGKPYFSNHGPHVPIDVGGYVLCDVCCLFLLPSEYRPEDVRPSDRRFRSKLIGFGREFASPLPLS